MLSLAVPVLAFPIFLEQRVISERLRSHGLVVSMNTRQVENLFDAVSQLRDASSRESAHAFASKYGDFFLSSQSRAIEKLTGLLHS